MWEIASSMNRSLDSEFLERFHPSKYISSEINRVESHSSIKASVEDFFAYSVTDLMNFFNPKPMIFFQSNDNNRYNVFKFNALVSC